MLFGIATPLTWEKEDMAHSAPPPPYAAGAAARSNMGRYDAKMSCAEATALKLPRRTPGREAHPLSHSGPE